MSVLDDIERDLANAHSAHPVFNLPHHVHATPAAPRVAQPPRPKVVEARTRGVPPPRPGPPPKFVPGASAYPGHIQAAYEEASPEARAAFDRAQGRVSALAMGPGEGVGFSAGLEDLNLQPSYPVEVAPDVPVQAAPPPARTRRDAVRPLDASVGPSAPVTAPLPADSAGALAALTRRAAELTGALHDTFRQMTELLERSAGAAEPPEPEIVVEVAETESPAASPAPEPEPLPGPPPAAGA